MKSVVLLFAILALAASYPYAEEDDVINLGEPTFSIATGEFHQGLFVYFYEPFCTPCRKMWGEFRKAATKLKSAGSRARFAKVECHDEVKLCDARGVNSFPTLLLHRAGKEPLEYRGLRTADSMMSWLQKAVDNNYPALTNEQLFEKYHLAIVVNGGSAAINDAYKELVDQVEISKKDSIKDIDLQGQAAVFVTSSGNVEKIASHENSATIVKKAQDLFRDGKAISNFNEPISTGMQNSVAGQYLFFFRTKGFGFKDATNQAFESAAAGVAGQKTIKPFYVNAFNDILGTTLGKMFGVEQDGVSTIAILNKTNNVYEKYVLDASQTITVDSIKDFVTKYQSKSLPRLYISAKPTPYEVNEKSTMRKYVQEIVGSQYYSLFEAGKSAAPFDKYVFVHFYFPWCEWCVKLEPTWNTLAYRMRFHSDKIAIGKTDVSENDVKGFDMSEYPVLIFFKPSEKSLEPADYIIYQQKRDIASLLEFLFKNVPGLKEDYDL